ncbi:MAG: lycopene cyclase domain-containing protein [Haloarculaceae archaeon]
MFTSLTYLAFHALFVVPPLAGLVLLTWHRRRSPLGVRLGALGVVVVTALAVGYTAPWDRFLIERGAWFYGEGRVARWVWGIPLGELLFFVLQPLLTALWTFQVDSPVVTGVRHSRRDRLAGALAGLAVSAVGFGLLAAESTLYLGAILAWAGPVLALQWAVGWRYLLAVRRRVALAVGVPTLYLWAIDRFAIADGIWTISETYTTGVGLLGLPVEEMTFFLVTNCFVVQGLVLLPWVARRWRRPAAEVDRRTGEGSPDDAATGEAAGDPPTGVRPRWRR